MRYSWDERGNTTETVYDRLGRVAKTIDPHGVATPAPLSDKRGLVVETVSPDGTRTRAVYDEQGRAVVTSDPFVAGQATYRGTHRLPLDRSHNLHPLPFVDGRRGPVRAVCGCRIE